MEKLLISLCLLILCVSSVTVVNYVVHSVGPHYANFTITLDEPEKLFIAYQDVGQTVERLAVESDRSDIHYVELFRMIANTSYTVSVYKKKFKTQNLLTTFEITTAVELQTIKDLAITVQGTSTNEGLFIFPWPMARAIPNTDRDQLMIAVDRFGRARWHIVTTPPNGAKIIAGHGFVKNPCTNEYVVVTVEALNIYSPNGNLVRRGEYCNLHHDVVIDKHCKTLWSQIHYVHYAWRGVSQSEDGIVSWDISKPNTDFVLHGTLYKDYHVSFDMRSSTGLSNNSDSFSTPCAWAPNVTTFKHDWSHGNSLHIGKDYLYFGNRHLDSHLLFDLNATELVHLVGGTGSPFTFLDERARWYTSHNVQELERTQHTVRLLLFDNGVNRSPVQLSRGLEILVNITAKTIDFVQEFLFNYAPGKPCYAMVFGGVERYENGNTLVSYAFCAGDGVANPIADGRYPYVVEYNTNAEIVFVLKVDKNGYQPARGLYRTITSEAVAHEFEF